MNIFTIMLSFKFNRLSFRIFIISLVLVNSLVLNVYSQTLFSETFGVTYSSDFYHSSGAFNQGTNYTCTFNGVGLMTGGSDYLTTKTVYVASGSGINISFLLKAASGYSLAM